MFIPSYHISPAGPILGIVVGYNDAVPLSEVPHPTFGIVTSFMYLILSFNAISSKRQELPAASQLSTAVQTHFIPGTHHGL